MKKLLCIFIIWFWATLFFVLVVGSSLGGFIELTTFIIASIISSGSMFIFWTLALSIDYLTDV